MFEGIWRQPNPLTFCRQGQVFQEMKHFEGGSQNNLLRQLQGDLPVEKRPFRAVAARAGMNEEAVRDTIATLMQQGVIRKFGAILRHQRAGMTRNAMVVWAVPPDRTEEAGSVFASFREITHCYERRPPFEGRYNLFTMIHAGKGALEDLITRISNKAGIGDYQVLESLEEFKKSSMEYF
jgi:DNA-binding Lrp family transcriptional regulator